MEDSIMKTPVKLIFSLFVLSLLPLPVFTDEAGDGTGFTAADVPFVMKYCPGGHFPTKDSSGGYNTWGFSQENTVSGHQYVDPFWIGETEVTYELWKVVYEWAVNNGYTIKTYHIKPGGKMGSNESSGKMTDQHPVTWISWRDALVWCNALSEMTGYEPYYKMDGETVRNSHHTDYTKWFNLWRFSVSDNDSPGFRLPRRFEWEYAARYRDGNSWTPLNCASGATGDVTDLRATKAVAVFDTEYTAPVKSKNPNALGCYDMSGNVWEFVFDFSQRLGPDYYLKMGGSWQDDAEDVATGTVKHMYPKKDMGPIGTDIKWVLGFRLARNAQ